ncbi:MAG: MFS transporter [Chloroflexi bacterium]|nr:MFS transporter [Chloroflexota bacterium]
MVTQWNNITRTGSQAARALFLAGFSHFTLELCQNFLPVLYPLLIASMGLHYTQIGFIALIGTLTGSILQPFFGFLSDRLGPERVCALSVLWLGLLMGLVGLVTHYWLLVVLVGLASVGSAAYHPPGAVIATANSGARRGAGMSLFSVGGNLGAALSPLWITLWMGGLGASSTLTIMPIALVVCLLLYWQARQQAARGPGSQSSGVQPIPGKGYLPGLILIVIGAMTRSWFQVSLSTYLPAWIQGNGGTLAQGSHLLSIFLFAIGAGSLIGGFISDRLGVNGPWWVVFACTALLSPAYWMFLHTASALQMLALICVGIAVGCTYPTNILLAHDAWPHRMALASGMVMGIGWAPGGLGASFTGYVADHASLTTSLQFLIIPPLLGTLSIIAYRLFEHWRPGFVLSRNTVE